MKVATNIIIEMTSQLTLCSCYVPHYCFVLHVVLCIYKIITVKTADNVNMWCVSGPGHGGLNILVDIGQGTKACR